MNKSIGYACPYIYTLILLYIYTFNNMSQRQWLVIVGVWVMVFLFLGFPSFFIKALAIITGLGIIVFAYRIKFKEAAPLASETPFTDNLPQSQPRSASSESNHGTVQQDQTGQGVVASSSSTYQNVGDITDAEK